MNASKFIAILAITQSCCAFAFKNMNAESVSYGLTQCDATSQFVSGYAFWLGGAQKIVNDEKVSRPELDSYNKSKLAELNNKARDDLYQTVRKTTGSLNSYELQSFAREMGELLIDKSGEIAVENPGMSKIYYARSLNEFCHKTILGAKF